MKLEAGFNCKTPEVIQILKTQQNLFVILQSIVSIFFMKLADRPKSDSVTWISVGPERMRRLAKLKNFVWKENDFKSGLAVWNDYKKVILTFMVLRKLLKIKLGNGQIWNADQSNGQQNQLAFTKCEQKDVF